MFESVASKRSNASCVRKLSEFPLDIFQTFPLSRWAKEVVLLLKKNGEMKNNDIIIALNKRGMTASYQHISQIFKSTSAREFYIGALLKNGSYFSLKSKD